MQARLVIQGKPGSESAADVIAQSFSDPEFVRFEALVAFASVAAVEHLNGLLGGAPHVVNARMVVGVDINGTSGEALTALLGSRARVSIFYTPSKPIFHPKVYLFEGSARARLIVGSSNLTVPGLFQNVEASVVVDFDTTEPEGRALIDKVRGFLDSPEETWQTNLQPLTEGVIRTLLADGIVPTEEQRAEREEKDSEAESAETSTASRAAVATLFPPRRVPAGPSGPPAAPVSPPPTPPDPVVASTATSGGPHATPADLGGGPLLWRKSNLPASDVQQDKPGTAVTGGLRLTQAGWTVSGRSIDQTTYFRHAVFGSASWATVSARKPTEIAVVQFEVFILGRSAGVHPLAIRHKPSGEAGQGNYTTLISWGSASGAIRANDLRGRTLSLYGPPAGQAGPFLIKIA